MTQDSISTAADYADALLIARRAKSVLFVITALMLLVQLGLFFTVHYSMNPTDARINWCHYFMDVIDFLGVITPTVLAVDLLLIVGIMLVGRLIGISEVVGAFLWCVVLILLLFPWQAFLVNLSFTSTEFKIPGVLYTWAELQARAGPQVTAATRPQAFVALLFWGRFVAWPVAALLILLRIQSKARHGVRLALGEVSPQPIQPPPKI